MKKILVVLDKSEAGDAAQNYAIQLAKEFNVHLVGLAILDLPWITASQPEALGGSSFKVQRDELLIQNTEEHIKTLFQDFKNKCENENVVYEVFEAQGFPAIEIEACLHGCDALVMGSIADFHFNLDTESEWAIKQVIRNSARPAFIIPRPFSKLKKILIAYDGHQQSSKALHLFLLLGLGQGKTLKLLTISKDKPKAEKRVEQALKLCSLYNVTASADVIETDESPEHVILKKAESEEHDLIVMGVFSRNMLKEALFGSCTKHLLKKSSIPLFVFH